MSLFLAADGCARTTYCVQLLASEARPAISHCHTSARILAAQFIHDQPFEVCAPILCLRKRAQ
jgi:hypothetical protein